MNARTGMIASLSFVLLISACGANERVATPTDANPEELELEVSEERRVKQLFMEELSLNMSENEARELFGARFSLVRNAMDGNESWRYDFGAAEGYRFDDQGIDQVDIDGIKRGRVQQQLFIDWSSDGTLSSASLYMRSEQGDGYYVFELLSDGTRLEKFQSFD